MNEINTNPPKVKSSTPLAAPKIAPSVPPTAPKAVPPAPQVAPKIVPPVLSKPAAAPKVVPPVPPKAAPSVQPIVPKIVPSTHVDDLNTVHEKTVTEPETASLNQEVKSKSTSVLDKLWFGWIFIFLFWPFGLYCFWRGGHKKSFYSIAGIVVLGIIMGIFGK